MVQVGGGGGCHTVVTDHDCELVCSLDKLDVEVLESLGLLLEVLQSHGHERELLRILQQLLRRLLVYDLELLHLLGELLVLLLRSGKPHGQVVTALIPGDALVLGVADDVEDLGEPVTGLPLFDGLEVLPGFTSIGGPRVAVDVDVVFVVVVLAVLVALIPVGVTVAVRANRRWSLAARASQRRMTKGSTGKHLLETERIVSSPSHGSDGVDRPRLGST
mmetsp:Transcript_5063/g.22625  ORF Transcript_5063/g.22625 Transcript_5063/m.22625 type:complete len:219 (-) Transcript_5063:118-774(-)